MKKSLPITAFILIILFSTPALAAWYFDADSVTVDLNIKSSIDLERKSGSTLKYVTANVSFIPTDSTTQSVLSLKATPTPYSKDPVYIFRWDSPVPDSPGYDIDARVKTKSTTYSIRKIPFPYLGVPDDVEKYTKPAKNIDSDNAAVIAKASELAAGETDYYAVVFKFADWTKENVKYDLSTLNIKASRSASWVLAKRDGVCDEITTLFIAMLRSVGIPAKFVAGVAYTESPKFPQNWGAHGWAEVYFPGTGWVPFDVTYGQYGFIDPTHIKLKEAFDSGESDTRYEWLGSNINVIANPITVSADLVKYSGKTSDPVAIRVDVEQDTVDIGSYNLVEATITNRLNTYTSTFLYLAKINEMEVDGNTYKPVMLKPLETKKVYWLVKVMDNLDSHYTYTFPITVATVRNTSADAVFYVIPTTTEFSRTEMEQVVDAAEQEESKKYSKKIEINCTQEETYYYTYDDPELECIAKNTGNFPFKQLKFCFEDECSTADLAIAQEKAFQFTLHAPKEGVNKIEFSIDGKDVSKSFFYDLNVLDKPDISIDDIEYPAQIEFKQPYTVVFTLKKESSSVPQDITVKFDAAGLEKEIEVKELNTDKKMIFNLDSEDLSVKPNTFTIAVNYQDKNQKTYTEKEEFEVKLVNVTFGQRVVIWVYDIDKWLRNLFK
jgi:transglutaminase-like putative cysteine protease